jgi:pre-rRNA-processing protein TSR2
MAQNMDLAAMMQRKRATDEQLHVFFHGLDAVLMQWTALNLVTMHTDSTAATEVRSHVRQWFQHTGEVYSDELEDYFEHFFSETRSASIEDDSPKEVADVLHTMYCQCCDNNDSLVKTMQASLVAYQQSGVANMCTFQKQEGEEEGDSDDDDAAAGFDDGDEDDGNVHVEAPVVEQRPKQNQKKTKVTTGADGWKTVSRR